MTKGLDFIGDIHGCRSELSQLLQELGYKKKQGSYVHPHQRKLVFIGDLTDRGPDSLGIIEDVTPLVDQGLAYYVPGNHCDKLYRYFLGRPVKIQHGLETTVAELKELTKPSYHNIRKTFMQLFEQSPLYLSLDEGNVVAAHAGIRRHDIGKTNKAVRAFVLYGDVDRKQQQPGQVPKRRDWVLNERNQPPWIVYGHTPVQTPRVYRRTINIDTGCVFGGALTAFRYPELTTISIPSRQEKQSEKFRTYEKQESLGSYRKE
ncbi:diadenosine tetraphosphatase ApaH/serine/threonine PP2A family protein phosphatase [Geomicrobium halophilum]|uniref:Diadenosine tetraphosphatase ApaH/serine/threonine PP2A family protein phosphatase n=1 Tax=Geomicrobium halophilum TaxID=549000 RepID=A0A841PI74_9BACL|nr:bis(5'-nucleosyl)-tetraphosphatase PrpE [Geomicrobium halophilum]MBB6448490.1 diadenosine tetraphosphatase ApaH/serine/threonine PP2A family protein phosphatase [Geomicrobium halophilum]